MKILVSKEALFCLMRSHFKLAQAEYARNPSFNNTHFAHIAEEKILGDLDGEVLQEFFREQEDVAK